MTKSSIKQAQQILLQVEKSELGKSLFNLIQIHSKIKTPFDDIRNLIQSSLEKLKENVEDAYNKNYGDQINCDKLKEQFENTIQIHKSEIESQNYILEQTQESLEANQETFDLVNNRLTANQNSQEQGKQEREEQNLIYLEQKEEIEQTLAAIEETQSLLKHLQQGSSFFQLRQYFNKMKKAFKERKSSHILYKPIVQLLMQLNSSADQETISKILELLQRLQDSINSAYSSSSFNEQTQQSDWDIQLNNLLIEEQSLEERLNQLQQTITNQQSIVNQAQQGVEFSSVEVVKAQDNLDFTTQSCQQMQDEYASSSSQMEEEIEIFQQILDIFVNKIDTIQDYLKERVTPQ